MDELQLKLCDVQGRLFELSGQEKYNSAAFAKAFMTSETAKALDSKFNHMQWAGEEYLLEELADEKEKELVQTGEQYPKEMLFWIGYIYRYWHYYTGESSRSIYKQAPANVMKRNYMMFHTVDPQLAVDDLREIYRQKQ